MGYHNRFFGFSDNELQGISWIYNNTAWHNGDGTSFCASYAFGTVPNNILKNNIAFENQNPGGSGNEVILHATTTNTNNTWNGVVTLSTSDFASFDSTGVSGTRQSNGSLSVLNFLHLASGSDLIGAGVDVGLPYNGYHHDLGAFESSDNTKSAEINVTGNAGLNEQGLVSVYPNPVNGILNISANGDIKVFFPQFYWG